MKNAMQLKALIQNFSKSKNISSQAVMQNYMLERLLERISISQYKTNFILKGGFLISAMIGIDSRTTMDMDATIQKIVLSKDMVVKMFDDICNTFLSDNISFLLKRIEDIHEHNQYSGYRIHIEAKFEHLLVSLKVDITAGDPITPFKIAYDYKLLFEPRNIRIYAYNLETIIAEKLETIVSRGNQNTRLRDFYDIYILNNLLLRNIDFGTLRLALIATSSKRKTLSIIKRYDQILLTVVNSDSMNNRWLNYQSDFDYADNILFLDICSTIKCILDEIFA